MITFFTWVYRPTQAIKQPVRVTCHGALQAIWDFHTAIAYFFSVQAVFPEGPTSQEHFVPSLLVFSKILKILIQEAPGKPPSTSCLVLALRKGVTEVVGFFGSSLRFTAKKKGLGAFRGKQLRQEYHPIQLNIVSPKLPPYRFCAEPIPLQSNLLLWVPPFIFISTESWLIDTDKGAD